MFRRNQKNGEPARFSGVYQTERAGIMSFVDTLRLKIKESPFGSRDREILKVVLGDIQQKQATMNVTDEMCCGIVRKIVEANNINLKHLDEKDVRYAKYVEENEILSALLPTYLTAEQVLDRLTSDGLVETIKTAINEGKAVGVAMGHLKKLDVPVDGNIVKTVVQKIRTN